MKEKKQLKSWNIAITHWLTAGFVMPFLINLLAVFVIFPLIEIESTIQVFIIDFILALMAVWLGVVYSAKYLRRKYIIVDKNKVVILSTIYLFVIRIVYFLVVSRENLSYEITITIIISLLFYVLSNKYIKEDTINNESHV